MAASRRTWARSIGNTVLIGLAMGAAFVGAVMDIFVWWVIAHTDDEDDR